MATSSSPISPSSRQGMHRGPPMRWLDRLAGRRQSAVDVAAQMAAAYEAASRSDYTTALGIWTPLAHAGVARAQNNIGACFAEGLGVERDAALAVKWLAVAAEGEDPVGQ